MTPLRLRVASTAPDDTEVAAPVLVRLPYLDARSPVAQVEKFEGVVHGTGNLLAVHVHIYAICVCV